MTIGNKMNAIKNENLESIFFESLPLKYKCIWRIGVETGLRISDILKRKRHEIRAGAWVCYESKTGKKKKCTLTPETVELCEAYFKISHVKNIRFAFYNQKTKTPFTRQSVWKMFRNRATDIKLKRIGAHSSRCTSAWRRYLKTGDIDKVRRFLNHDNEKVTKLYLKNKR